MSWRGKGRVMKQYTLPTMPQRHMWLHRLLFFLDLPHWQQQQQQQGCHGDGDGDGDEKTPVLVGRSLQLPPTSVKAGLVQPQVTILYIVG